MAFERDIRNTKRTPLQQQNFNKTHRKLMLAVQDKKLSYRRETARQLRIYT